MTQHEGACAEQKKQDDNGISVKADKDFGAIELALVVNGQKIGFFLNVKEAHDIAESLKGAICKMMGDDTCGGRCSDEELVKVGETNDSETEETSEG